MDALLKLKPTIRLSIRFYQLSYLGSSAGCKSNHIYKTRQSNQSTSTKDHKADKQVNLNLA